MDVRQYFAAVEAALQKIPFEAVDTVVDALMQANLAGQTVYIFGNGGSAATASHFACDLAKRTIVEGQPRFRVISLTDNNALLTALSNDIGYDQVFAEQLRPLVRPGDIVIGISASGNSPNVLNAVGVANAAGATTIGFCGFDGGRLKDRVDLALHIDHQDMAMVEDIHLMLEHAICEKLRALQLDADHSLTIAERG
ncbi:MAG: SIS domain-containing protein [Anaerolineae bacterium]|nr:SIS domain-containing protein [Anaerolineae bacterium]